MLGGSATHGQALAHAASPDSTTHAPTYTLPCADTELPNAHIRTSAHACGERANEDLGLSKARVRNMEATIEPNLTRARTNHASHFATRHDTQRNRRKRRRTFRTTLEGEPC